MMWLRGRTLGRGSYGFVSLAVLQGNGDEEEDRFVNIPSVVAVKSAPLVKSKSLQKESMFLETFKICPYIIGCFGSNVSVEGGVELYNILLEYASNGSLADRIWSSGGKALPENEVRQHTKSLLMGLSYIHRQGYVHCDIKPGNILMVDNGVLDPRLKKETAKLADFGFVKEVGKTITGGLRGTPLYMAPESVASSEYEPHSDIWALGCTVLQMITGEEPWPRHPSINTFNILYVIGYTNLLPYIPKWLPKEVKDFLNKCLIRDPKARWTADMLLRHPFVSSPHGSMRNHGVIGDRRRYVPTEVITEQICESLSQTHIDWTHRLP